MAELTKGQRDSLQAMEFVGIDVSLDISLFEYGYLYSEKLSICIIHRDGKFDWEFIEPKEIIEQLEGAVDGFFSYIGSDKDTYIKGVNERSASLISAIHSLEQYQGAFFSPHLYNGLSYEKGVNELLRVIQTHANIKDKKYE